MNDSQILGEVVRLIANVQQHCDTIEKQQSAIWKAMQEALKHWDRTTAQRLFELSLHWNELHEMAADWRDSLTEPGLNTYVVDTWFIQDLIRHLTPGRDEEITHVTGPRVGPARVLSRICQIRAETKSLVYARASAQSCADTEIEILEHGNLVHAMAHSHPGSGAGATHPSSIDTNYLGTIQRIGAEAIGIIVTRDGWVRFFTVTKPFRIFVMGDGFVQKEEYVFHVTPTDQNSGKKDR